MIKPNAAAAAFRVLREASVGYSTIAQIIELTKGAAIVSRINVIQQDKDIGSEDRNKQQRQQRGKWQHFFCHAQQTNESMVHGCTTTVMSQSWMAILITISLA